MSRIQATAQLAAMVSMAISPPFEPCRVTRGPGATSIVTVRAPRHTAEEAKRTRDALVRALEELGSGIVRDPHVKIHGRDHVATVDYDISPKLAKAALHRARAGNRMKSVEQTIATALSGGWRVVTYGADNEHPDTVSMMISRGIDVLDVDFRAHRDTGFFRRHKMCERFGNGAEAIPTWRRLQARLLHEDAPDDVPTLSQLRRANAYTSDKTRSGMTEFVPTRHVVTVDVTSDNATIHTPDGVEAPGAALRTGDKLVGFENLGIITHARLRWNLITGEYDHPGGMMMFFEADDGRLEDRLVPLPHRFVVLREMDMD